jgi:Zn-dependent peptidase ImmA (M78 family)
MTFHREREVAVQQARSLLARSDSKTLPVAVEAIARQCQISVQYVPLDDEISGMAFIRNDVAIIVVNAVHHPNRQRFTLAHELAHHILHANDLRDHVHVDTAVLQRNEKSSAGNDIKEVEANSFAAELLMPQALLKAFGRVDVNDEWKVAELARKFRVSPAAMAIRLESVQYA